VEWVRLFKPGDLEVLDPSHGPALTLVTCFPFEYVGAAPIRRSGPPRRRHGVPSAGVVAFRPDRPLTSHA
jgi:hypothetical protein